MFLEIIIILLIVYVGILHFQLYRKNQLIETFVKTKSSFEDLLSKQGLDELIRKINLLSTDSYTSKSKLLENSSQEFIFENKDDYMLFVHYTREHEVAQKICDEGFRFADSFHKTAEALMGDTLDLTYKHYLRKNYGKYVVIISISRLVYEGYLEIIKQTDKVSNLEHMLSLNLLCLNDNQDEVYLLPKEYVKGYINADTGEIYRNEHFNPHFQSPYFRQNLDNL
jgi:hypothetical protein